MRRRGRWAAIEYLVIGAVVLVAGWLLLDRRAKAITRRHAQTLAEKTGLPPDQIYREILSARVAAQEWAMLHGLDPVTFEPDMWADADHTAWLLPIMAAQPAATGPVVLDRDGLKVRARQGVFEFAWSAVHKFEVTRLCHDEVGPGMAREPTLKIQMGSGGGGYLVAVQGSDLEGWVERLRVETGDG